MTKRLKGCFAWRPAVGLLVNSRARSTGQNKRQEIIRKILFQCHRVGHILDSFWKIKSPAVNRSHQSKNNSQWTFSQVFHSTYESKSSLAHQVHCQSQKFFGVSCFQIEIHSKDLNAWSRVNRGIPPCMLIRTSLFNWKASTARTARMYSNDPRCNEQSREL